MKSMLQTLLLTGVLSLGLSACGGSESGTTATLSEGAYVAHGGSGYASEDEAKILTIGATLDRAAGQLVFTMEDGTRQTLTFTPRPEAEWPADCATNDSSINDEIADLSPAPLKLESMTFTTPVVYAKCSSSRMILANDFADESLTLILDLVE